jgi:hypothetical protein
VGVQSWTFAAAYQQLGDDAGADRIVENIGDPETRWAARAVLVHAAVETGRQDRAASLTRALAAAPIPDGSALAAVRTLAAGSTDRTTAAVTAPMAERAAATVGLDSRDEAMTIAAQLWLRADKPEEALRIAHPIAKRVRRDFNSAWYADLATVLSDAGDAKAGTALFDRHVEWYEQERTVADDARAVLALAHHGRGPDAEDVMENLAEPRLKHSGGASFSDSARRVVVDAYLALDDVASAIRTTVGFSSRRERIDALLTIAFYGHDHDTPSTPEIAEAFEQIG